MLLVKPSYYCVPYSGMYFWSLATCWVCITETIERMHCIPVWRSTAVKRWEDQKSQNCPWAPYAAGLGHHQHDWAHIWGTSATYSDVRVAKQDEGLHGGGWVQPRHRRSKMSYEAHLTVEERLQHNTCTHMHEMTYMFIIQEFNMEHTRYWSLCPCRIDVRK